MRPARFRPRGEGIPPHPARASASACGPAPGRFPRPRAAALPPGPASAALPGPRPAPFLGGARGRGRAHPGPFLSDARGRGPAPLGAGGAARGPAEPPAAALAAPGQSVSGTFLSGDRHEQAPTEMLHLNIFQPV